MGWLWFIGKIPTVYFRNSEANLTTTIPIFGSFLPDSLSIEPYISLYFPENDFQFNLCLLSGEQKDLTVPRLSGHDCTFEHLRARSANLSASTCEVSEPDRLERPVRLSEFLGLACSANLSASICEVNEPDRSERPVRLSEFLGLARSANPPAPKNCGHREAILARTRSTVSSEHKFFPGVKKKRRPCPL